VIAVEPEAHRVALSDGTAIGYRTLIWATGGRPRRLSCAGHDLKGVHVVRARADVDTILEELAPCSSLKSDARPDDFRKMGHVACLEYYAIAHVLARSATKRVPPLNLSAGGMLIGAADELP
jgi:NADPH-dependent 2,4-dienoyl-CoA reductase/sulfur reductase-like enzyme